MIIEPVHNSSPQEMNVPYEEWVVHTLKEYESRKNISKVLKIECKTAVSKGDNYTGEIDRLTLTVVTNSGTIEKRSVIRKKVPEDPDRRDFAKNNRLFLKEIWVFKEVIPLMEAIRQEVTPEKEPIYAQLYGTRGNDDILLEDLAVLGYRLAGDRKGLDFNHCKLTMEALGVFHALGSVLKQRGDLILEDFDQYFFEKLHDQAQLLFKNNFNEVAWILENQWKGECAQYAGRLRNAALTIADDIMKLYTRDESNFNVLLHGDAWMNNMMFRYNTDGTPAAIRLLDFQIVWYNRCAFDVNYHLWTSAHRDTRRREAELVRLYYDSLRKHLELYGYRGRLPSLEEIQEQVESTRLWAFGVSLCFLPFMMTSSAEIPDIGKFARESNSGVSDMLFIHREDRNDGVDFRKTIEYILREACDLGLI